MIHTLLEGCKADPSIFFAADLDVTWWMESSKLFYWALVQEQTAIELPARQQGKLTVYKVQLDHINPANQCYGNHQRVWYEEDSGGKFRFVHFREGRVWNVLKPAVVVCHLRFHC